MNEDAKFKTASDIALLAPIPLRHLESALVIHKDCKMAAFGSDKSDVFRELDKVRNKQPVDVYIYASHADGHFDPEITWVARYIRSAEHCDRNLRPSSTITDTPFRIYWIVDELRRERKEHLRVAKLIGYGKDKQYGPKFVPKGPMLIKHPQNHP